MISQAGIRETKEETGIDCEIIGLVGIYTDPKDALHYTSNDEVRQEFPIVLTCSSRRADLRILPDIGREAR